jgi:hypothetical protein
MGRVDDALAVDSERCCAVWVRRTRTASSGSTNTSTTRSSSSPYSPSRCASLKISSAPGSVCYNAHGLVCMRGARALRPPTPAIKQPQYVHNDMYDTSALRCPVYAWNWSVRSWSVAARSWRGACRVMCVIDHEVRKLDVLLFARVVNRHQPTQAIERLECS